MQTRYIFRKISESKQNQAPSRHHIIFHHGIEWLLTMLFVAGGCYGWHSETAYWQILGYTAFGIALILTVLLSGTYGIINGGKYALRYAIFMAAGWGLVIGTAQIR